MSDIAQPDTQPLYIRFLLKLGNYLVSATLLCYLTGFAITNLYLGSLGIVNLDILRARYVLAGLLFLSFLLGIAYLVYGLIQTLRKNSEKSALTLIAQVLWYSFISIGVLYLIIAAIAVFAGTLGNTPVGIPQLSPAISWSDWFATVPTTVIRGSVALWGGLLIVALILLILSMILAIVNPRDEDRVRIPRRRALGKVLRNTWQERNSLIPFLLGGFLIVAAWVLLNSLLSFASANKISVGLPGSTAFLTEGWLRYFGIATVIYGFVALYLTSTTISPPVSVNVLEDDFTAKTSTWIYIASVAVAVIVPIYALAIYPNLPQQIGGGSLLQVDVMTSSKELSPRFAEPEVETYLIDRASDTTIFLLVDKGRQEYQVLEVSNSLIEAIIYNPSP